MKTESRDVKPEKSDGFKMDTIWREEITVIAGPYSPSDTRESWLSRAARRAGVSVRTAKSLFYGETIDPRDSVAQRVRGAAAQARKSAIEQARQYEHIAASLAHKDEDFHGADIVALIDTARALRGLDRS